MATHPHAHTSPRPTAPETPARGSAQAPAGPPASPPARPARNALPAVTLVVSILALVVGLSGVILSAIALGRSDKATTLATRADSRPRPPEPPPGVPQQGPPPTAETEEPSDAGPTESASPGEISPTAEFKVKYDDQHLRVQSPNCQSGYRIGVDLDEPRVLSGPEGDITYGGCRPGTFETDLPLAEVSGKTATPADCLENIRTSPAQSPIAPSNGLSVCLLTSPNAAASQGITQKLVILSMDSVTENNEHGIFNITLKAWDVPE